MSDHSNSLDLSADTLRVLMESYRGYANAMEESAEIHQDQRLIVASCYAIAAMYAAMIDQRTARDLFIRAARFYLQVNHSYWKLMAVCGMDGSDLIRGGEVYVGNDPTELFYELMRQFYLYSETRESELGQMMEHISSSPIFLAAPVGRSGITLGTYYSLFRSARGEDISGYSPEYSTEQDLRRNLETLIFKSEERYRFISANSKHWQRQIGIVPFEPDVLAALVNIFDHQKQINRREYFAWEGTLSETRMSVLMSIAREMIEIRPDDNGNRRR